MRSFALLFLLGLFSNNVNAQEIQTDTFIRKHGIYPVPPFTPWEEGTLFAPKKSKNKVVPGLPLLSIEAAERLKLYIAQFSEQKNEPFRFFRVLEDLAIQDSSAYLERLNDMPPLFQSFFRALYYTERNQFDKAIKTFDSLQTTTDSLLMKEVPFWKTVAQKLWEEQLQHDNVLEAYTMLEENTSVDSMKLFHLLNNVSLPQYKMHRFINLFNHHYREKHYHILRSVYDSILTHTTHSKMKASLVKNRTAMLELLESKESFIIARKNDMYHYEIDYLYDHLETWKRDTLTDKTFSALAGFKLHQRSTTKTDSIFTRRLTDTAAEELLSKFEILSLIRTPIDKAGRRFVMVKLGFSNDSTYKKYEAFLSKFKSKPIQQSVIYAAMAEGDEYMLTQYFIAALFHKNDPVIKYELSIYSVEDAEGNSYAVDTLF